MYIRSRPNIKMNDCFSMEYQQTKHEYCFLNQQQVDSSLFVTDNNNKTCSEPQIRNIFCVHNRLENVKPPLHVTFHCSGIIILFNWEFIQFLAFIQKITISHLIIH